MQPTSRYPLFWTLFLPLLLGSCGGCGRHWEVVGEMSTHCTPAIGHDPEGPLMVAVVDTLGRVAVRSTVKPGVWSEWTVVADGAEVRTSPYIYARKVNTITFVYVYYRGQDNNLYRIQRFQGEWADEPFALTNDGSVQGRMSLCHVADIVHCVHVAGPSVVRYRSGNPYNFLVKHEFAGALEGTITNQSETTSGTVLVLRYPNKVTVYKAVQTGNWLPEEVATKSYAYGTSDISNVVHLDKKLVLPAVEYDHHVLVDSRSARADTAGLAPHELQHWLIDVDPEGTDHHTLRIPVAEYGATTGTTLSSLAAYRTKLVAVWRTASGGVSNARLDDADPALPWITRERIRYELKPDERPALYAHDHLPYLAFEELRTGAANYGNDLYAAASQRGKVMFEGLSRTWFQELVDDEFMLFHSPVSDGCAGDGEPNAPVRLGAASGIDSPYITELGFGSWVLPDWLIRGQWRKVAGYMCTTHPDWQTKGRTPLPCGTARMPVIMKEVGGIYFCAGPWMNYYVDHTVYWEELGHYLTFPMGICNEECAMPTEENTLTAIPLAARREAHSLFQEGTTTSCGDMSRCPGFTGTSDKYDMTGREHSFIYMVDGYINRGPQMRAYIQQDLAGGSTLLRRKYNWVRDVIFRGVEF